VIAAVGGEVFALYILILAGLALVIYAIVGVVRLPGLTTGAKWMWGLGLGIGYWFFWLPGIALAIVFLTMRNRWSEPPTSHL